jgi:hypothetical protein
VKVPDSTPSEVELQSRKDRVSNNERRVGQNGLVELSLPGQKNHAALVFAAISYCPSQVFSTWTGEVICPL